MRKLSGIEQPYLKADTFDVEVGDTVNVKVRITEQVEKRGKLEEKERIQIFGGVVIGKKGSGIAETFTVRRIVAGEGVERVFPIHSPSVTEVEIVRRARVRRAKLYYLRDRSGKSARLRERIVPRAKTAKKKKK